LHPPSPKACANQGNFENQKPGHWPGFFLADLPPNRAIVDRRQAAAGHALSNPAKLTNLGTDRRAFRIRPVAAGFARLRRAEGGAIFVVNRSSGWGRAGRERRSRTRWELLTPGHGPLCCEDFERLCHVATDFQI
jgi:hypothetical protein